MGVRWSALQSNVRIRIIAFLVVPTVALLVAVATVTYFAYHQVTEELVVERDRDLTRLSASQLATQLAKLTEVLDHVETARDLGA